MLDKATAKDYPRSIFRRVLMNYIMTHSRVKK